MFQLAEAVVLSFCLSFMTHSESFYNFFFSVVLEPQYSGCLFHGSCQAPPITVLPYLPSQPDRNNLSTHTFWQAGHLFREVSSHSFLRGRVLASLIVSKCKGTSGAVLGKNEC